MGKSKCKQHVQYSNNKKEYRNTASCYFLFCAYNLVVPFVFIF